MTLNPVFCVVPLHEEYPTSGTFLWSPPKLISKGRSPFFGPFWKFGQVIVDAIFVQKISNSWWTCGLVLASRRTNFYKIPISGYTVMPQKHIFLVMRAALGSQKTSYLKKNWVGFFYHRFLTIFLNISSTWKSSRTHQIN
jgi:hypothetical protein